MLTCEHCGMKEGTDKLQEIKYGGYSAWLCWRCIASVDEAMEDVAIKYLH